MNKKAILEGLLFLSGSEGLTLENICDILEVEEIEANSIITNFMEDLKKQDRGLQLEYLGNHLKLTTKKEHKSYYEKLVEVEQNQELSQAALETLAIIAYNEPLTRIAVDEIRGVNCSHLIRKLVSMNLICECGKADTPGRPVLYKTTKDFLDHFGLSNIEDLPKIDEIEVETEETDLFESKYKEQ